MSVGVLVMAYGTPSRREEIETFYTDVRRGRAPSPEQLTELVSRYDAIGGVSPLKERTAAQIRALQAALDARAPGRFQTYYGAKHADPKLEAAVDAVADDGHEALVGLVLAPHYSSMSIGEYVERVAGRAAKRGLPASLIERWADEPALLEALATRVTDALLALSESARRQVVVLFSAHSLPARVLEQGDPYPSELEESAARIASLAGISHWRTAWQSAGRTPDPWLGPDVCDVIDELAKDGATAVVVCPQGFTSDHLEVLYDLDVMAAERAASAGIAFVRTASINAEPSVFDALAARLVDLAANLDTEP